MAKAETELQPANWQVTATTIHCELVEDFVTIMVNKDWTTRCAWYKRYKQEALEDAKRKFSKAIRQKIEKCDGPECSYLTEYRAKLLREESSSK